jgi:hypothetical protein
VDEDRIAAGRIVGRKVAAEAHHSWAAVAAWNTADPARVLPQ